MRVKSIFGKKAQRGFTLIELMTTAAIITLLGAMAIPQFMGFRVKAKRTEAVLNVGFAGRSQLSYLDSNGRFLVPDYRFQPAGPCYDAYGINMFTGGGEIVKMTDPLSTPEKEACGRLINEQLGIGSVNDTPQGYVFEYWITTTFCNGWGDCDWDVWEAPADNQDQFFVMMTANFDEDAFLDQLGYQVQGPSVFFPDVGAGGYPDGTILLLQNDQTNTFPPGGLLVGGSDPTNPAPGPSP